MDIDKKGYYKYHGVSADQDVQSLVERINKPESICSMCPEDKTHSIDHYNKNNVVVKSFT